MKSKKNLIFLSNLRKIISMAVVLFTSLFFSGCDIDDGGGEKKLLTKEGVVEKAIPSLVNIIAVGKGAGSGVILSQDGYILTNDHVVKGANDLEVHLSDQRTIKAKLVGRDSRTDLAVIKADGNNFRTIDFADSDKLKKAESVVAIGNAQGVENSVTDGIISNLDIDIDDEQNIRRYLQTNTAINPGNSGGALLNMYGDVIGINTLTRKDSDNIGYAIPSNVAKEISDKLIENGYISWPCLGVDVVNKETKEGNPYIQIRSIMDNSPASKAGLKVNDVIYQVNDVRVEKVSKLREQLNNSGIGTRISVYIVRATSQGSKEGVIEATLEELPKGYYTIDWS